MTQPDSTLPAVDWRTFSLASPAHFDVAPPLDRSGSLRDDVDWVQARLIDPTTLFVPVWRLDSLIAGDPPQPAGLSASDIAPWLDRAESLILLGLRARRAYFAVGIPDSAADQHADAEVGPLTEYGRWANLRTVSDALSPEDWAVLAYARAMVYWHQRCRFCSDCGHPTTSAQAGHMRRCANPACGRHHFPRTDPAIIVLVVSPCGERALLGRQPSWPTGRYSTLAGFMEPGETVEQAVAREVYEETGIRLSELRYFGSQSFPFPASLMLGFHAQAVDEHITLRDGELADARWFTRQALRAGLDAGAITLPQRFAISHRLISAWFNAGSCGVL
ncbi:MAG: NAD(+) diphosphatase [Anaerolineae bacterium]|nr:NAD(+) diphosphatase [Thermoflexales bacterium]MDW8406381.1 NAD(+) diphosphatase [Anaerolineae bacterium]